MAPLCRGLLQECGDCTPRGQAVAGASHRETASGLTTSVASPLPGTAFSPGTIHIELQHGQVRIEGSADPLVLRVVGFSLVLVVVQVAYPKT
jgi:hypothetical protein